jgi:atypical dual specificity phosphatase
VGANPGCLLVDEPLSDVAVADEQGLIRFLRGLGQDRAVVVILHNKIHARALCDRICLITGGTIVEEGRGAVLQGVYRVRRQFLQAGVAGRSARSGSAGRPTGRHGAMPVLRVLLIVDGRWGRSDRVCSATRTPTFALSCWRRRWFRSPRTFRRWLRLRINGVHFPIRDMGIPDVDAAWSMCWRICGWIDAAQPTVLHCRAGLGRTGTMLACVMVARGFEAGAAVRKVRTVNPRYIQTQDQFDFVERFAKRLAAPAAVAEPS